MASDDHGDNPWTRPSVFLSIAFLVLALIAGTVALIRTHPGAAAAVPSASAPAVTPTGVRPSPTSSTTPRSRSTTPTVTALPDQTVPVTAPPATWITVETLSLPTSPLYGPKINDGTVMAGYQHSPTGALFATTDNRGRFALVRNWKTATLSAVADTPGRAVFLAQRQSLGTITPTPGEFTQLAGFNFVSYTPDRAVIQILSLATDGSYTSDVDTVIWENGDWRLLLSAAGDTPPLTSAPSAAGYVPWKATY